jgi:hypothetical protein
MEIGDGVYYVNVGSKEVFILLSETALYVGG